MDSNTVIFISAGLDDPKKSGNPFAANHSYLNYGLLGLASILSNCGYEVKLFHGKFMNPLSLVDFICGELNSTPRYPIFLSLPSVFAIDWSRKFISKIKTHFPKSKIIVGGRWVVETDGSWIRRQLGQIDLVVYGTAEKRIESFMNASEWANIPYTDCSEFMSPEKDIEQYPKYDYKLMSDYLSFQPSIEVSRGCGLGCGFCMEKDSPLIKLKNAGQITKEVISLQEAYNKLNITPYFEASFFRPSSDWAAELRDTFKKSEININWRTETRIDGLSDNILSTLAETGLKVLDIGLESASQLQIKRMNKSANPKAYLTKASRLLKLCKELNIWAKVNILLYAGETHTTLNETIDWLEEHRDCIKGLSVNPLMVYGHDLNTLKYMKELEELGAKPVDSNIQTKGYSRMHLSETISFDESEKIRIGLSQSFMTNDDYYDLKSFSYFPQSFTKSEFNEICNKSELAILPFRMQNKSTIIDM
jgi:radical SAM superfamily enzyme YgiQ (UPF0313 family)